MQIVRIVLQLLFKLFAGADPERHSNYKLGLLGGVELLQNVIEFIAPGSAHRQAVNLFA
jgi:hypothetical protein